MSRVRLSTTRAATSISLDHRAALPLAKMEAMNWGETQSIVHALIRVFEDARDSEAALRVREVFDELSDLFTQREQDMRKVIKGACARGAARHRGEMKFMVSAACVGLC